MKKIFLILALSLAVFTTKAQEFGAALHAGYLTEIGTVGFGADLLYEIDDTWGVASNVTFAFTEVAEDKLNWLALDLNVHYTFVDELYALAGGEYLTTNLKDRSTVGGFSLGENKITNSEFGVNLGAGYRFPIVDNVSIFTEVKYVVIEAGYVHARAGLHFSF